MSNFKTDSPVVIELHNKDIKFQKYEAKDLDSLDKSTLNKDKTVLVKRQFKIVNNLKNIKGIFKVPNVKYDDDTISMGSGLNNPGINICYMNVVIQVLSHTPFLSSALLKSYHTKVCKNHENNIFCVMCLFEKYIIKSYMSSNPLNNPFYGIAKKYIYSKFKLNQQDDSFIFLKYFLDSLSKSCYFSSNTTTNFKLANSNINTTVFNRKDSVDSDHDSIQYNMRADEDKSHSSAEATTNLNDIIITNDKIMHTFIGYLFGGYFRNVIICNGCNYKSEKVEEFFELSVETTKSNELINLLNDFVVPEQLEGSNKYYCSECKSLQNATKLLSIYKCPQILTVHLKRFNMNLPSVGNVVTKLFNLKSSNTGSGSSPSDKGNDANSSNNKSNYLKGKLSKLMKRIHFPHNLSISLETKKGHHTWVNYEIYAIVCHLGHSLNSGHYITFIKGKNNFWFLFDDSTVRLVSNDYVKEHENDVYILFYSSVSTSTSEASSVISDVSSIDNILNEYSETNRFCVTSSKLSEDSVKTTSKFSGTNEGKKYSDSENGSDDVNAKTSSNNTTDTGDASEDDDNDENNNGSKTGKFMYRVNNDTKVAYSNYKKKRNDKLIHILSSFKGKIFNTFVKFRKFKNYKLLTIRLLSNAQRINMSSSEKSDSESATNSIERDINNNTTQKNSVSDCNSNHNNDAKKGTNQLNKCSLKRMFSSNEVDVWSDEEDMDKIKEYKRLYSSLKAEVSKPEDEEIEYDKGRQRKYKKKKEDEHYKFISHHTGVQLAVNQKDIFDSTGVKDNKNTKIYGRKKYNKFKKSKFKFKRHN